MTMRNEISAMANKIEPNPDGEWFNTNSDAVRPGDVITSNGILYNLGNVRHGFDNDGDYAPDYNAWMQPVGDAAYDPSCFRLIRTHGVLTISRGAGKPDLIIVDLMMEEVDAGTAFVKELRLLNNTAPVYMLSSVGDNLSMTTDYSELGLSGVFQKPLDNDMLLSVLKSKLK